MRTSVSAPASRRRCPRRTRSRSCRLWPEASRQIRLRLMARRRLKLIFGPDMVKEPVIYQLGKQFELVTNIRRADVSKDQGWVLLEVTGEPDELDRGVEYLESRGVKVEPAEGDLVG